MTSPTGILPARRSGSHARIVVPPRLGRVVGATLAALGGYVALSIVLAPSGGRAINFVSEQGSVTMLSTGMLLMAACFAGAALWSARDDTRRARQLWTTLTAVMLYFSVDEVMEFHERMGDYLTAHVSSGPFRNWNDIVVILYGTVAAPVALLVWHEVLRYRRLFTMLVVTGLFYVGTTSVDTLSRTPTDLSNIVEEGLKGTCSTLFVLSMLTGLVAVRAEQLVRNGQDPANPTIARRDVVTVLLGMLVAMAAAGLTFLLPAGGHGRDLITWIGSLSGVGIVMIGVVRMTRDHADPASGYADFWTDRAAEAVAPRRHPAHSLKGSASEG
jgi:hypothetical protein